MPLSTASIAGIILAIFVTLSLISTLIIYTNKRHRRVSKGLFSSPPSIADASPSMSPPTLIGPKKRSQALHHNMHTRYPNMENGPGPTFSEAGSKLLDRPVTPGSNTPTPIIPSTAGSTATAVRHKECSGNSSTNRPSSLHQAVLGRQEESAMKEAGMGIEVAGEKSKAEEMEANMGLERENGVNKKPRGYTGAWP